MVRANWILIYLFLLIKYCLIKFYMYSLNTHHQYFILDSDYIFKFLHQIDSICLYNLLFLNNKVLLKFQMRCKYIIYKSVKH